MELLERATEPGAVAAPRHVLTLTKEGGRELRRRLAEPRPARHHRREPLVHRPLRTQELDDPFRRGILTIARVTSRAELTWMRATLELPDD